MVRQFCHTRLRQLSFSVVGTLVVSMVALLATSALAQGQLLWGSLKPGPHSVGYQSLYQLDYARQYDPEYVRDSDRPPAACPRPILICIWYPAQITKAEPMAYREYLNIASDDPKVAHFAGRLMPFVREVVCDDVFGKSSKSMTAYERAAFERLLNTKSFAVKDAPAAEGRFPVIINHPGLGGVHEDNSVLFEYLASHGYVVLCSAFQNSDANRLHIGWDLDCSFRDMEFLSRYASSLSYANVSRLGVMGHSYGGQAAIGWHAEPASSVSAVVTFDTGLENEWEGGWALALPAGKKLKTLIQDNRRNLRASTLRFAPLKDKPHFEYLDSYLKLAPRYEATVAMPSHKDFLTHGVIRPALMPDNWTDAKKTQTMRVSYDLMCEYVLQFLDASLKQRPEAQEFLQKGLRGEGLDEEFKLQFRQPNPAPPTARQLAQYIQHHGVNKAIELIQSCRNDIEVGGEGIGGAGTILLDAGQTQDALTLFNRCTEIFPNSRAIYGNLAHVLVLTGDKKNAISVYRKLIEHIPMERDIDEKQKAEVIKQVEQEMKKLGWDKAHPDGK